MTSPGSIVAGYRVLEMVGSGPFGRVLRAEGPHGEPVCLKLLKPNFLARRDGAGAFGRLEASVAVHGRLVHPNLARVYGTVQDPAEQCFGQVGEDLRGTSLAEAEIEPDALRGRDPGALGEVLSWFEQIGDLLTWLHGQGMVHGNIKPTNVLLVPVGIGLRAKLLDLSWSAIGVAAVAPGPDSYVSPEQYAGSVPTHLSDQWALATMLERLLTGGRRRLSLGVLPGALVQTVHRATSNDPARRFPAVAELAQALREIRLELQRSAGQQVHGHIPEQGTLPAGRVPASLRRPSGRDPGVGPEFGEEPLGGEEPTMPGAAVDPELRAQDPFERATGDYEPAPSEHRETVRMSPLAGVEAEGVRMVRHDLDEVLGAMDEPVEAEAADRGRRFGPGSGPHASPVSGDHDGARWPSGEASPRPSQPLPRPTPPASPRPFAPSSPRPVSPQASPPAAPGSAPAEPPVEAPAAAPRPATPDRFTAEELAAATASAEAALPDEPVRAVRWATALSVAVALGFGLWIYAATDSGRVLLGAAGLEGVAWMPSGPPPAPAATVTSTASDTSTRAGSGPPQR